MSKQPSNVPDHDRFDASMRQHHAASVAQLSPQVSAQLVQRRNAAKRGEAVHRGHGVRVGAAAFATLCALAIGLQLRPTALPGTVAPADATVTAIAPNGRAASTMLDEDPEFYAWLASSDAQQVAME